MDSKLAERLVAALAEAKVNAVLATQTKETPVPDYMVAVAPQQVFNVFEMCMACRELGFEVWFDQDGQFRIVPPPDLIPVDAEETEEEINVCICPTGFVASNCPIHGDDARQAWQRTRTRTRFTTEDQSPEPPPPHAGQARTAENDHLWDRPGYGR